MIWVGRPGDIVAEPILGGTFYQAALIRLCSGMIWPPSGYRQEPRAFLANYLSLLDSIFYFERVVLFESFIDDPIIKELRNKRIISHPEESPDWESYESKEDLYHCIGWDDPRSFALSVVLDPIQYINWLHKSGLVGEPLFANIGEPAEYGEPVDASFRGGFEVMRKRNKTNALLRQTIDLDHLHEIASAGNFSSAMFPSDLALCLTVEAPVIERTSTSPYSILMDRLLKDRVANTLSGRDELIPSERRAIDIVLKELYGVRGDIVDRLYKKGVLSFDTVLDTPFSLDLLLSNCKRPTEILDTILELRKDSRGFRKWLASFDKELRAGNVGRIAKAESEVVAAAKRLRDEFSEVAVNRKISRNYTDLASESLSIIDSAIQSEPQPILKKVLAEVLARIGKWRYSHIFYMQKLGSLAIQTRLAERLKHLFGEKQTEIFTEYLREIASRENGAVRVANLPLAQRALLNFALPLRESRRWLHHYFEATYFLAAKASRYGVSIQRDNGWNWVEVDKDRVLLGFLSFFRKLKMEIRARGLKLNHEKKKRLSEYLRRAETMSTKGKKMAKTELRLVGKTKIFANYTDPQMAETPRVHLTSSWYKMLACEYYAEAIAELLEVLGDKPARDWSQISVY